MPLYNPITNVTQTFIAPQEFTGYITVIVDGIRLRLRPVREVAPDGRVRIAVQVAQDGSTDFRDAGSQTYGS